MFDITVTVTGPGGVISYELEVIRAALVAAGLKVEVKDPHPSKDPQGLVDNLKPRVLAGELKPGTVKLVAIHCPWGG